jgi:hypothetical protein
MNGELRRHSQFVAGSGIIFSALLDAERLTGVCLSYADSVNAVLERQLPCGGFTNFIGYRNKTGTLPVAEVWEDHVPVVGWNAHMFEYLTRVVPEGYVWEDGEMRPDWTVRSRFAYLETSHAVIILSLWPLYGAIVYVARKRLPEALVSLRMGRPATLAHWLAPHVPERGWRLIKKMAGR